MGAYQGIFFKFAKMVHTAKSCMPLTHTGLAVALRAALVLLCISLSVFCSAAGCQY